MPAAPNVAQPEPELVHRSVRLRLLPESRARAHQLAGTAGACRFVWNHFVSLKRQQYRAYRCWQDYKIGPERHKPNLTFFGMGLEFTALRRDPRYAWLQEYSFGEVRYVLKHLADAYRAFFQGTRGQPRFQSRHRRADGFTIPQQVRVRGPQLYVPRVGWLRVRGYNPHAAGQVRQARLRQEGTASRPRWYVYLVYAVPADSVRQGAESGVLGLDRNVGQVTDSAGRVYRLTDLTRLEAKVARYQRRQARQQRGSVRARRLGGQLQKLRRQQQRIRANDTHQISRALADQAHTLVVEDLHTQGMTQSAKGTQQSPGTHVKAKAGLNRGILASNWGQLAQRLQCAGSWCGWTPGTPARPAISASMWRRATGPPRRCSGVSAAACFSTRITMPHLTFGGGMPALGPAGQGQLHGERRFHQEPHRPVNTVCLSLCTQVYKSHKKDWIHRSPREQKRTAVIADCQCHRMQSEKTKQ